MALIECPECGNKISDKSNMCIHCGFPMDNLNNSKQVDEYDFDSKDTITVNFEDDYEMKYLDGKVEITRNNRFVFRGDISEVVIYRLDETVFGKGFIELRLLRANIPQKLKCESSEDFYCLKMIFSDAIKKKKHTRSINTLNEKSDFEGVYRRSLSGEMLEVYCPYCGSSNCSHRQNQKTIPGKTKTTYSANLNPFKPFTILNKNEKTVKKETVITENSFLCNKCGKIFN